MNARNGLAVVVMLIIGAMTMGCGVSKTKYTAATQSVEDLTNKNRLLQQTLDSARATNETLQQSLTAANASAEQLKNENTELKSKVELSAAETQTMESTYKGLVDQLKGEVQNGSVQIQQQRDGIDVSLSQDILFKSGSANLDKTGSELLTKVAEELKKSNAEVLVIGHTDNQKIGGSLAAKYPTNWELGSARASQIARLFQKSGIGSERMIAMSAADGKPRADNATAEGRAQNRRIEIRLRPNLVNEAATN